MLCGRTTRARRLLLPFQNKPDISTTVTVHVGAVEWSALVSHNEVQGSILDLIIFAISQEYIRDINVKCETICYAQFTVFSDMMSTFPKQIWTFRRNLVPSRSTQCHIPEYWPPRELPHKIYCHTNKTELSAHLAHNTGHHTSPQAEHSTLQHLHYRVSWPSITCSSAQLTEWHHCNF
jgi:hypothetical protein